jgi:hypothetical protein
MGEKFPMFCAMIKTLKKGDENIVTEVSVIADGAHTRSGEYMSAEVLADSDWRFGRLPGHR